MTHVIYITLHVKEMKLTSYYTVTLIPMDALNGSIFKFNIKEPYVSKYSTTDETNSCLLNAIFTHQRIVVSISTIIELISIILFMQVQIHGLQLIKNKLSSILLNLNTPSMIHNLSPSHILNHIH